MIYHQLWPLTSAFFQGRCLCPWCLLMRFYWWYSDRNIIKKAFAELLCYSWIYRPWARKTFRVQTRHVWDVFRHSRVKVFSRSCYRHMIAMTTLLARYVAVWRLAIANNNIILSLTNSRVFDVINIRLTKQYKIWLWSAKNSWLGNGADALATQWASGMNSHDIPRIFRYQHQGPLLLTWFNFSPSMDK